MVAGVVASRRHVLLRFVLAVAGVVLAVLLVEGAHSAWTGVSLLRRALGVRAVQLAVLDDAARIAAAGLTKGPFALARDPAVGVVMKPAHVHAFLGVAAHTDAYGQRRRPGPPPQAGAQRIVVLGDSVAFGLGVGDEETYGHQLERALAAAVGAAPPPVVHTVACPGWNTQDAVRYLQAHLERLAPDLVVYLPVDNDLDDGSMVSEIGQRVPRGGPASWTAPGVPARVPFNAEGYLQLYLAWAPRAGLDLVRRVVASGSESAVQHVLRTGVTPESKRRWGWFAATLADLAAQLERRGARLLVCCPWDGDFHQLVRATLARRAPAVPCALLFRDRSPADSLDGDPHPNAECVAAGAQRIATLLVERGWVAGVSVSRLPPLPAVYRGRLAEDRWAGAAQYAETVGGFVGASVELERAAGIHQVYGGLAADGTVGRGVVLALRCDGAENLVLDADPVVTADGPLLLDVAVRAEDGQWMPLPEPLRLTGGRCAVALPAAVRTAPILDVRIAPRAWRVEEREGRSRLAAFRLRRAALQ